MSLPHTTRATAELSAWKLLAAFHIHQSCIRFTPRSTAVRYCRVNAVYRVQQKCTYKCRGKFQHAIRYRKSYKSLDRFRGNKTTKPVSTSLILKNLEDFYGMIRMLGRKFIIRNVWARWFLYLFGSSHIFQAVERGEWSKNKGRLFKWNEALVKIYGDKWYNRVIAAHTEGCLNRDGCMMVMMFYWCLLCV